MKTQIKRVLLASFLVGPACTAMSEQQMLPVKKRKVEFYQPAPVVIQAAAVVAEQPAPAVNPLVAAAADNQVAGALIQLAAAATQSTRRGAAPQRDDAMKSAVSARKTRKEKSVSPKVMLSVIREQSQGLGFKRAHDPRFSTGLELDSNGTSYAHWACHVGSEGFLKDFLSRKAVRASINTCLTSSGDTFLHFACVGNNLPAVKLLLASGAQFNTRNSLGQTPLFCAASEGYEEIVNELWRAGASLDELNDEGATALHYACYFGHGAVVSALVSLDANRSIVSHPTETIGGTTALLNAALKGHSSIIRELLNSELTPLTDVNQVNEDGVTALHNACIEGHLEAVETLVEHGATVNAKTCHGITPLMNAVIGKHYAVVKFLLTTNCELNITSEWGDTALHYACMEDDFQIAKLLVEKGALTDLENTDGETPLILAKSKLLRDLFSPGLELVKGDEKKLQRDRAASQAVGRPAGKAPAKLQPPRMAPVTSKPKKVRKKACIIDLTREEAEPALEDDGEVQDMQVDRAVSPLDEATVSSSRSATSLSDVFAGEELDFDTLYARTALEDEDLPDFDLSGYSSN